MKKQMSKKVAIPVICLICIVLVGLGIGNYFAIKYDPIITTFLGQTNYKVVDEGETDEDTEYFKSEYS